MIGHGREGEVDLFCVERSRACVTVKVFLLFLVWSLILLRDRLVEIFPTVPLL